jgi:hypothetical protein
MITPAAANSAGAKWAVDGGVWQNSGAIVAGLSVGTHTVSFSELGGWTKPAAQTISISSENGAAANGFYAFQDNYGLVANGGFETGDFTGWTLLGDAQSVFADDGTEVETIPQTGVYDAALGQVGSLGYLSQTLATTAGGNYSISFWVNSDRQEASRFQAAWNGKILISLTNLPPIGWTNIQFLVSATAATTVLQFGFQNDNGYLALDNVRVMAAPANSGALQVNLSPIGAISSGALWQVDGGTPQVSGAMVLGLSVGTHTVSFSTVNGWTKPADQIITIKNGQTTNAIGLYTFLSNYGLVKNGGFQNGNLSDWTLNADTTATFVDNGSLTGITPQSDSYSLALGEVGGLGYLSQTLTTTPGTIYLLSFWLNSDGYAPNRFVAYWNGQTLTDQVNLPAVGWTNLQFSVTATAASTLLRFGFRDDNSYLGLDNISLVAAPTPVTLSGAGLRTNQFGFTITGPIGLGVVVEASTDLGGHVWVPVRTNILNNGSAYFSDPSWAAHPVRLFRLKW